MYAVHMTQTMERTPTLKATDRCDRCGAAAMVETQHLAGNLMWCGHDWAKVEHLISASDVTADDRWTLTYKPAL